MNTTNSNYNPHDHLVTIRAKDGSQKPYYPAAWRLYELNLRYPNANFSSEILLLDVDRNLVVVKCRLYLGADYELSEKKTEAMKSGPLSSLDKVETAAKARCARDFGVSTELALDFNEAEEETEPIVSDADELKAIMAEVKALGLAKDKAGWQTWRRAQLGKDIPVNALTHDHITLLRHALEDVKMVGVPSSSAA